MDRDELGATGDPVPERAVGQAEIGQAGASWAKPST